MGSSSDRYGSTRDDGLHYVENFRPALGSWLGDYIDAFQSRADADIQISGQITLNIGGSNQYVLMIDSNRKTIVQHVHSADANPVEQISNDHQINTNVQHRDESSNISVKLDDILKIVSSNKESILEMTEARKSSDVETKAMLRNSMAQINRSVHDFCGHLAQNTTSAINKFRDLSQHPPSVSPPLASPQFRQNPMPPPPSPHPNPQYFQQPQSSTIRHQPQHSPTVRQSTTLLQKPPHGAQVVYVAAHPSNLPQPFPQQMLPTTRIIQSSNMVLSSPQASPPMAQAAFAHRMYPGVNSFPQQRQHNTQSPASTTTEEHVEMSNRNK